MVQPQLALISCGDKEKYNHRMVNEFVAFIEIFKQQDLITCYKTLEHSLNVMKVLEQARIKWQSRILIFEYF